MTSRAWSEFRSTREPMASPICFSTNPPISRIFARSCCSSSSYCRSVCSGMAASRLAESASDVIFSFLFLRGGEEFIRLAKFYQPPQIHESRKIRNSGSLLHVVRHDHNRVALLEFMDQFFDFGRGDGIQSRAGLVHQHHLRLDRNGAGNAQALMLAPGQPKRIIVQAIFGLVPQRRTLEAALDDLIKPRLGLDSQDPWPVGDILIDGFGKRVGFLKDH